VNVRYYAAVTNDDKRRHWSAADSLSANTASGASIRRTLSNRARYGIANNSYARGIELEKRCLVTMLSGRKMGQIHAEQPKTSIAEFKQAILNEIACCLIMPFNVTAGTRPTSCVAVCGN